MTDTAPDRELPADGPFAGSPPAAFWRRVAATIFDLLCAAIGSLLIFGVRTGMLLRDFAAPITDADTAPVYAAFHRNLIGSAVAVTIFLICYFILAEYFFRQATFGKITFGIRVQSADGLRLKFHQVVVRLFGKIFLGALTLGLSWGAALLSKRRQAWHDRLAKTIVVEDRRPITVPA